MHDVLRFWLDRGIDGFRMDVIHCIGKDPALPDDPPELAALSHVPLNDRPETHELLKRIHGVLAEYPGDRMSVGEVYLLDTKRVVTYLGGGDQLSLSFNFPPLFTRWDATKWRRQIEIVERGAQPGRRMADLGAVEPRHHAAPVPLRVRGPGPSRGRAAAHPAGCAVPLRRRGARAGRRPHPRRPGRRPRWPRRVPGPDPVGRRAGPRVAGGRTLAALASRGRAAQRGVRAGRPVVDAAPLPAGAHGPPGLARAAHAATSHCSTSCPRACSATSDTRTTATAASC